MYGSSNVVSLLRRVGILLRGNFESTPPMYYTATKEVLTRFGFLVEKPIFFQGTKPCPSSSRRARDSSSSGGGTTKTPSGGWAGLPPPPPPRPRERRRRAEPSRKAWTTGRREREHRNDDGLVLFLLGLLIISVIHLEV